MSLYLAPQSMLKDEKLEAMLEIEEALQKPLICIADMHRIFLPERGAGMDLNCWEALEQFQLEKKAAELDLGKQFSAPFFKAGQLLTRA